MWELYLQKVSSKEDVCSQIKKKDGFRETGDPWSGQGVKQKFKGKYFLTNKENHKTKQGFNIAKGSIQEK